ncbi:MAG TPA: hypothetical protein PKE39_05150 [Ignavibacteria bacterium]|nr:hypothetical protein [Ignavibacteria bacterium]HMQ98392.1 hypothetical protein [Ignavibacteria bacterium]
MKRILLALIIISASCTTIFSQLKDKDNLLGGSVGFWAKGEVPMFGVNFESQLTQAGIGTVSLGGIFRYYSYSFVYTNGDSRKYSFTSIGLQSNYNFNQIGDGKFVPFAGLVLGYNYVNSTYTDFTRRGVYVTDVSYRSGAWLWGQLGMRYFFSPNVAGSIRLGLGNNDFNTIELGVDFKL